MGERPELPEAINELTGRIIKADMEVHTELGPGLYEKPYKKSLAREFARMGIRAEREVPVPVVYKGELVDEEGYKLDFLVEDTVVFEGKSVETIMPVHKKQVLTYLRLTRKPLGLLVNFNVEHLRDGIYRIIDPRRPMPPS
jgi:GxxExxY protein